MNMIEDGNMLNLKQMIKNVILCSPGHFTLLMIISFISGALPAMIIHVQSYLIDVATLGELYNTRVVFIILIVYLIVNVFDLNSKNVITYITIIISNKLEKVITLEFLGRVASMQCASYENSSNQDVLYRIKESIKPIIEQCVRFLPNLFIHFISLASVLFYLIPVGMWWVIPISILMALPSLYFNKKRVIYARKVWEKDSFVARYTNYLHSILINGENAKERKLFQFKEYIEEKWIFFFKQFNKNKIINYCKSSLATGIAMCFSMSNILVFGLVMLEPLQSNHISIGLYVSLLQMIITKFNYNLNALIREVTDARKIKDFTADLNAFKKFHFEQQETQTLTREFHSLEFDNVWFSYPGHEENILCGVSFKINKGEHIALIGLNGAGKTTITKLMLGLYKPTDGRILLNGVPLENYSFNQIQSLYAYMQQDVVKYRTTVRNNIGLYHIGETLTDKSIDSLLYSYNLSDIKTVLLAGYDTYLTPELEKGISISGGQWNKISIARALYANRDFYILDEPTAALDPIAEVDYYQHFSNMMKEHTCFYITHRLGCTYLFDRCLVLNRGKIEEQGSHKDLINIQDGIYRDMYMLQKAWYERM